MSRLTPISFAVAVVVALLGALPARPCSPPLPSVSGTAVPEDGDVLPVNGVIHARMGTLGITPTVRVRADTELLGRTIDVDNVGGVFRLNLTELAPATSYSVHVAIPTTGDAIDAELTERTIHFTTTTRADTTAPRFAGNASVDVVHEPAPPGGELVDSCGGVTSATNRITIVPPEMRDDVGVAGVKVFRRNDDGTRELRTFRLRNSADDDGVLTELEPVAGAYVYELVAVDLAGNESEPLVVDVDVDGSTAGCNAGGVTGAPVVTVIALALRRRARRAKMAS